MKNSVAWQELENLLIRLGNELEKPASLVIIDSTVCMSLGQPDRMTMDVDVWRRNSVFDLGSLKAACEKAGIAFNPQGYDEPAETYLQLIDPGIVQLGVFEETNLLFKTGNLEIRYPPVANLIASKLVRGESQDFDDCAFLARKCDVGSGEIIRAIESIDDAFSRESALENITILQTCISLDESSKLAHRPQDK